MQHSQRWINFSTIFRVKNELGQWFIEKKVDKYGCRVQHWQFKPSWGSCNIKPTECLYCTKISQVPVPLSCRWKGDPGSGSRALCCTHNPQSQLEAHAHHHISLLVQKNGKERFPAYKRARKCPAWQRCETNPEHRWWAQLLKGRLFTGGALQRPVDLTLLTSICSSSSPTHMSPGGTSSLSVYLYVSTDSPAQTTSHPGLPPGNPSGCPSSGTKISPQIWICSLPLRIYTS